MLRSINLVLYGGLFLLGVYVGFLGTSKWYDYKYLAALYAQIEHNEKVIKWSREYITALLEKQETLQKLVNALDEEADKDPNANRPALGADSVRRINQVR